MVSCSQGREPDYLTIVGLVAVLVVCWEYAVSCVVGEKLELELGLVVLRKGDVCRWELIIVMVRTRYLFTSHANRKKGACTKTDGDSCNLVIHSCRKVVRVVSFPPPHYP